MSINDILKRAPLNGLGASRQEAEIAKLKRKIAALKKMLLPLDAVGATYCVIDADGNKYGTMQSRGKGEEKR